MPVLDCAGRRILYIHVPKAAGSAVEGLLRSYGQVSGLRHHGPFGELPCSPQHFHGSLLEHIYSAHVTEPVSPFDYVFMTVRDPIRRFVSELTYGTRHRNPVRQKVEDLAPKNWDRRALSLIRSYGSDPYMRDNHLRPQHEFEAFAPEVFRIEDGLESLKAKLDFVCGIEGSLPTSAVNASRQVKLSLGPKVVEALTDLYQEDFLRYSYPPPNQ
ncbi:sulfotransferase family 2 domain-containing protein [Nocardioides bruguierae]|uniref:sulfotransferase family 2 domain-containing protein n=1 Tax=Nocardioides bruguierae TaxID=2945102 RepID=UPI003558472E